MLLCCFIAMCLVSNDISIITVFFLFVLLYCTHKPIIPLNIFFSFFFPSFIITFFLFFPEFTASIANGTWTPIECGRTCGILLN